MGKYGSGLHQMPNQGLSTQTSKFSMRNILNIWTRLMISLRFCFCSAHWRDRLPNTQNSQWFTHKHYAKNAKSLATTVAKILKMSLFTSWTVMQMKTNSGNSHGHDLDKYFFVLLEMNNFYWLHDFNSLKADFLNMY